MYGVNSMIYIICGFYYHIFFNRLNVVILKVSIKKWRYYYAVMSHCC